MNFVVHTFRKDLNQSYWPTSFLTFLSNISSERRLRIPPFPHPNFVMKSECCLSRRSLGAEAGRWASFSSTAMVEI